VTREHILAEILRTATESGSAPLGQQAFASQTGIQRHEWHGKYWTRWSEIAVKLQAFASARGYTDVASLCEQLTTRPAVRGDSDEPTLLGDRAVGYVYLLRHGTRREFKIGRTNNPLRREGEIGIELPQRFEPIHVIETDDPAGIETYRHRRFADRRLKNEWFALTADDVRAFRR